MPTKTAVNDFVSQKIDDFLEENADALAYKIEKYNVGLKYFWGVPTFWRGLESKAGVKSISADAAIYDEFDEADPGQLQQARQRLAFSGIKLTRELSVPTLPDFGINRRFQLTDQCHYAFKCPHCSRWNILEENWPHAFRQRKTDSGGSEWFRACKKCHGELDVSDGQWVPKNLGSKIRGYQISQLYSPFASPTEIMEDFHSTEFMGHFHNHVLGLPYLAAEDRVAFDEVLGLCDSMTPMHSSSLAPCAMGIDVGSKLHVVCIEPGTTTKVRFIGELKDFEQLDQIILRYNVRQAVIDALPETRKSREFVERNRFKNWICYYSDNLKGDYGWNEQDRIVTANRTESLDAGTLAFTRRSIVLPQRSEMVEEFARHCANTAKIAEENRETGSKRYVYKKLGPDHFRHALNYAMIAASRMRSGPVISIMR